MQENPRILFLTFAGEDLLQPRTYIPNKNSGDTVYFMAGMSWFYDENFQTRYMPWTEVDKYIKLDEDWVRRNFDICIYMEANIFSVYNIRVMEARAKWFLSLKIPIYILGAGAQSTLDYSFANLNECSDSAKRYVESVLKTGGTITLRGEFTKAWLESLGLPSLFVSG